MTVYVLAPSQLVKTRDSFVIFDESSARKGFQRSTTLTIPYDEFVKKRKSEHEAAADIGEIRQGVPPHATEIRRTCYTTQVIVGDVKVCLPGEKVCEILGHLDIPECDEVFESPMWGELALWLKHELQKSKPELSRTFAVGNPSRYDPHAGQGDLIEVELTRRAY